MRDVLFLDFDGVLNFVAMPPRTYACRHGSDADDCAILAGAFDEICIQRLNQLVRTTGVEIVLSTSWRLSYSRDKLIRILEDCGFEGRVVDTAPRHVREFWRQRGVLPDQLQRGHQIAAWLIDNADVRSAVIVDDCADMWILEPLLVHTNERQGLTEVDISCAIAVLAASAPVITGLRAAWPII
jgi:hypothetical protein